MKKLPRKKGGTGAQGSRPGSNLGGKGECVNSPPSFTRDGEENGRIASGQKKYTFEGCKTERDGVRRPCFANIGRDRKHKFEKG